MCAAVRILFIDDCADDVFLAEEKLRRTGIFSATRTVQTEEALREALEHWCPDIVISDLAMPSFDGYRAFSIVRTLAPGTPFVFRTGGVQGRSVAKALSEGATGYVEKGNDVAFVALVTGALNLKPQ